MSLNEAAFLSHEGREEGGENVPLVQDGYAPVGNQVNIVNGNVEFNISDGSYSLGDKPYDDLFSLGGTEGVTPENSNQRRRCDCRRLPKVILSFISVFIFLSAFVFPILHVPLYIEGSPFAGGPDFIAWYDTALAPPPNAIAHVYLLNVQACINNMNLVHGGKNASGCSHFKNTFLFMNNETLSFQIEEFHFVPGINVEYFTDPTIRITGTLALFAVLPLFLLATAFYCASLFGSRRHFATIGAIVSFAVACLGMPMALYGFSVDSFSTISLTSQVGIHQSILPGILMVTAVGIQITLIWFTCVCCCFCHRSRDGRVQDDGLNRANDSVLYKSDAKTAGIHRREVIFNIILWLLSMYLWVVLALQVYCAYIAQCPSEDLVGCEDTDQQCTTSACEGSVCSNMSSYGLLKGFLPFWVAHVIVSYFSPAAKALRNSHSRVGTKEYVDRLKRQPPHLWFHIQNFYIEEYSVTRNGFTTTQRRRVNTSSANGHFEYNAWFDRTPKLIIPRSMADHLRGSPTRIHSTKDFSFANNATRNEYERQYNDFLRRNHNPGEFYDPSRGLNIQGFEEFGLAYQQYDDADVPMYFRYRWHFLSSLFMVTPLYEFIFYAESMSADLQLWKFVSI